MALKATPKKKKEEHPNAEIPFAVPKPSFFTAAKPSMTGSNVGGKSAIADHVSVCARVRLAAKSGVTKSIVEPGDYAGFPAQPAARWRRRETAPSVPWTRMW